MALLIVAGCAETGTSGAQVSRNAVRAEVERVFNAGCMQQMKNLSQSGRALAGLGLKQEDRQGGTTIFSNLEKGIVASSGDFSVTRKTGGVTVATISGDTCFVGSPMLGRAAANDIVDRVRTSYLTGRVGYGHGKTEGYTHLVVSKDLIGKPFEVASVVTFVAFDEPQIVKAEGSRTVTLTGTPLFGVAITVFDQ